ncbi:helix-turn-helix transcriptional regulator [Sphingobium estronivorans]|uniref:helix-turn-helix transcriptional regulator n=1 Tax=Sphingobium estronivorans TaxID=1577690 RepID=UPI00123895A7|nr:helix-turn-helix transcriptional regulator [Sphingobium estronivorans]
MSNHELDREHLLNILYESLSAIPAWHEFLIAAGETFASPYVSLILDARVYGDGCEPVIMLNMDDAGEAVKALHRSGFFRAGAEDQPDEHSQVALTGSVSGIAGGVARVLTVSMNCREYGLAHFTLWRDQAGDPFDGKTRRLLKELVPSFQRALKLFFQTVGLQRRLLMSTAALETSGIGIILATPDGTMLMTNSIADVILAEGAGMCLFRGKLKATNADDTARLLNELRLMAAEQQAEADWRVYAPLALRRPEGFLPLTVIVRPGPAFHPLRNPLQRTALLILRDPEHRPIIPASTLSHLFGLTPAEALLASEIARGASVEEAANHIGISRNTARSQLQSVFLKTGTNRQGELVRMLLSSAASLST